MALNLDNGNGLPRVDIESLLWEMRDILRGLSQVNKAQSAEIERLSGKPAVQTTVAAEYDERAVSAIRAVDAALDQLDARSLDGAETQYDSVDVAAWIQATNDSLHPVVEFASDVQPLGHAQTDSEVPNDFWDVHDFKWEDEPEELLPAPSSTGYSFEQWHDEPSDVHTVYDDDDLSPSDSITDRGDNDTDDDEASEPHSSNSNDDSATLFHAEDDAAVMRAVERHAYVTGQRKNSLDTLCDVGVAAAAAAVAKSFSASAPASKDAQTAPLHRLRDAVIAVA